jgi:Na+-driven multidrug efflux pump
VRRSHIIFFALLAAVTLLPQPALAYVGPGSGLGALGAALAFVGAVLFAIIGFLWYPMKRLLAAFRAKKEKTQPQPAEDPQGR